MATHMRPTLFLTKAVQKFSPNRDRHGHFLTEILHSLMRNLSLMFGHAYAWKDRIRTLNLILITLNSKGRMDWEDIQCHEYCASGPRRNCILADSYAVLLKVLYYLHNASQLLVISKNMAFNRLVNL